MGKKLVPLESISQIEEGVFAKGLDEDFKEIQQKLISHVRKYGLDATKKSKAELVVKIVLQHDGTDEGDCSIKASTTSKLPGRPIHVTKAIHVEDDGKDQLFVRASGSDSITPRQMKLATDDGRGIDPDTTEALPRKKKETS